MTDRIQKIKDAQWERRHHAARIQVPEGIEKNYRKPELADHMRTAVRLETALKLETPYFFEGELIAFTRTVPDLPFIFSESEWAKICASHFIHEKGNISNLSPDYEKVIARGLQYFRDQLTDSPYHQAMRISIDAVLDLAERYEKEARAQGFTEIADTLARVPRFGAKTFREALQSLRVLHYALWCEGDYHNTLGRFDQYMFPYLDRDLREGRETRDSAFELLEAFFLSCNRDNDLYTGMQAGDNGQSIVLGGMTKDGGKYGFNLISEMALKASGELRLIDPKINLRVCKDTPPEIFELGTELTKLGLGFPQYENDDVAIAALEAMGYAPEDARNYAMAACWEFIIPGRACEIPNIGAMPLAGITNEAIRKFLTDLSRKRREAGASGMSAEAGKDDSGLDAETGMDELKADIQRRLRAQAEQLMEERKNLYIIPSPLISLFFEGCLEKGRDISLGNRYNNWGFHGTGLAPAADMLAAVEQYLYADQGDPAVLLAAMDADFHGYEVLHDRLKYHAPKMGNDDDRADQYAVWLLGAFSDSLKGLVNERGGIVRAGTGSAMYYISHAQGLGATADGREADVPLPANYAPSLNIRLNGPVSLIRSFTKPDLSKVMNGGPLTIEFSESVFAQEEAIAKVAELVRMFVRRGGHQIQLNTVNRDRLLDAQKHPENYRNLIVRVWGWSGYFVELDKCYQDHIIRRAELLI